MRFPVRIAYLLLAAAGFIVFFAAYPRSNQSPTGPIRFDLHQGRVLASQAASAALGVDTSSWSWFPNKDYNHTLFEWQKRYARRDADLMLSPFQLQYIFLEPVSKREVTVSLSTTGIPSSIRVKLPARTESVPSLTDQQSADAAERIFRLLAGPMQAEFGPRERSAETDALEYLWKSPYPNLLASIARSSSGLKKADWKKRVSNFRLPARHVKSWPAREPL
jgi:hypothetical protein